MLFARKSVGRMLLRNRLMSVCHSIFGKNLGKGVLYQMSYIYIYIGVCLKCVCGSNSIRTTGNVVSQLW